MDWGAALLTGPDHRQRARACRCRGRPRRPDGRRDARLHGARTGSGDEGPVDARADVFGLGAILFLLLTGEAPAPGGVAAGRLESRRDVPAALRAICARAMASAAGQPLPDVLSLVTTCVATAPAWLCGRTLKRCSNGQAGSFGPTERLSCWWRHTSSCASLSRSPPAGEGSAFGARALGARAFGARRSRFRVFRRLERTPGRAHRIRTRRVIEPVEAQKTMNKPVLGLMLGGFLGIFDGLSALVSAPETAPGIVGIVIGSTFKGVLVGALAGWFARRVHSVRTGVLFGLLCGAFFAFLVAADAAAVRRALLLGDHAARQRPRDDRRLRHAAIRPPIRPVSAAKGIGKLPASRFFPPRLHLRHELDRESW